MSNQQTHHLASKIKLYPNSQQGILFKKTLGCCRFIYNYYLAFKVKGSNNYKKAKIKVQKAFQKGEKY
jgi:putative transposase